MTGCRTPLPPTPPRSGEGEKDLLCSPSPLRGGGWGEGLLVPENEEGPGQILSDCPGPHHHATPRMASTLSAPRLRGWDDGLGRRHLRRRRWRSKWLFHRLAGRLILRRTLRRRLSGLSRLGRVTRSGEQPPGERGVCPSSNRPGGITLLARIVRGRRHCRQPNRADLRQRVNGTRIQITWVP